MDAYLMLVGKARVLCAYSRNREMILAQILADPSFDAYVREDTYHKLLTAAQKSAFAKTILADALDRDARSMTLLAGPQLDVLRWSERGGWSAPTNGRNRRH